MARADYTQYSSSLKKESYNSGCSQFFIMTKENTNLNGYYAAFGKVTEGMDIVDEICKNANPTDDNGTIKADEQPVIDSIQITD